MFNHLGDTSYELIPGETFNDLDAWGREGRPPGDFARAVLRNNLFDACHAADSFNLAALPAIVRYIFRELPRDCWGSRQAMERWSEQMAGQQQIQDWGRKTLAESARVSEADDV